MICLFEDGRAIGAVMATGFYLFGWLANFRATLVPPGQPLKSCLRRMFDRSDFLGAIGSGFEATRPVIRLLLNHLLDASW